MNFPTFIASFWLCFALCGVRLAEASSKAQPAQGDGSGASVSGLADARRWFDAGQSALATGNLDAAERDFQKVLSADPRSGAAYANLGVVAMRRKQWDKAL